MEICGSDCLKISESSSDLVIVDFSLYPDVKKIEVEENVNTSLYLKNIYARNIELVLKRDAKVSLKSILTGEAQNINIHGYLKENAAINAYIADFSSGEIKANIEFDLDEIQSSASFRLASVSALNDRKNFEVSIYHNAKNTYGLVDNYGVSKDASRLIFAGTSYIKKDSKFTKTQQNAKIMIFDPTSNGICRPILRIDENEIEANHSASLGKPNEEHLFYLMSRGLSEQEAKRMIIMGYLNPILSGFENEEDKSFILKMIEERI